ncbi:hypothetical protein FACS1894153_4490 [Bacteroidia bacterium]|nr:hypothetical protein FACS1894153_4490 [Bacteroidia bacterium]
MQFLWKYVEDLSGKGLDIIIIVKLLYYTSLTLVPMALPLTVLLASLMTFGNLGERYELVAAKASGISLIKVFRPLFYIITVISIVAFIFSNDVYPYAFKKYRVMLHDVQSKKPALNIAEGEYYDGIDGYSIRFMDKESDGKTIHDVIIYDHTENLGNTRVTMAKHGLMETTTDEKTLQFTLFDGYSYTEDIKEFKNRQNRPFSKVKFGEQKIKFDLSSFQFESSDEGLFNNHYKMKNLTALQGVIDTLYMDFNAKSEECANALTSKFTYYHQFYSDSIANIIVDNVIVKIDTNVFTMQRAKTSAETMKIESQFIADNMAGRNRNIAINEVEWQRKFTLPFACLLLFMIGAPLGAIIRKGGLGMPIVVSVLLFISYYLLSVFGEKYAISADMSTSMGMWLSAIIFAPIGLFIMLKATTDAALLDADVWKRRILRLFGKRA